MLGHRGEFRYEKRVKIQFDESTEPFKYDRQEKRTAFFQMSKEGKRLRQMKEAHATTQPNHVDLRHQCSSSVMEDLSLCMDLLSLGSDKML